MNAIIGGLGQLDNTAANAFVDYMADFICAETGQNVFAINWGAINVNRPMKVNVLHQFIELSTEHKKNSMTDEEVNEIYDRLLSIRPGSRIVISTIDMNTILKNWNRVASIEELAKDRPCYQVDQQRELSGDNIPQNSMQQWVAEQWSLLIGLPIIGLSDNFFAIGGHSLAAVQFVTKVKDIFNIKTHVMNLYEMPTLQEFSEYLEKQIQQRNSKEHFNFSIKTQLESVK
jgi:polyketide synthase PksJ